MKIRILCAGFGGQGALLIGKLVAQAGMMEGKHVTWLPSYGPEMRGGTANVMTVISDKPVGSPIFTRIDVLVALNQPSLEKFLPQVVKGGVVVANASLCKETEAPEGVKIVMVPLTSIAEEVGDVKVTNMVALGALLGYSHCVKPETIEEDLRHMMQKKNPALLSLNLAAIQKGMEFK
ncbi:MAG: 2-oxoacid:acceptor oxidoreductase family protein [Thermodesulfobacteriota bacterium]